MQRLRSSFPLVTLETLHIFRSYKFPKELQALLSVHQFELHFFLQANRMARDISIGKSKQKMEQRFLENFIIIKRTNFEGWRNEEFFFVGSSSTSPNKFWRNWNFVDSHISRWQASATDTLMAPFFILNYSGLPNLHPINKRLRSSSPVFTFYFARLKTCKLAKFILIKKRN